MRQCVGCHYWPAAVADRQAPAQERGGASGGGRGEVDRQDSRSSSVEPNLCLLILQTNERCNQWTARGVGY